MDRGCGAVIALRWGETERRCPIRRRRANHVILTKVRIQSRTRQRLLPWILTFVRMTEERGGGGRGAVAVPGCDGVGVHDGVHPQVPSS